MLFRSLLSALGLTISAGLKQASGLQLGSENRLEILLDSTSEFARKALDQSDNRARIEAEILRLTGRTVSIALRLTVPEKSETQSATASIAETLPATSAAEKNMAPANQRHQSANAVLQAATPLRNLWEMSIPPVINLYVRSLRRLEQRLSKSRLHQPRRSRRQKVKIQTIQKRKLKCLAD